MPSQKKNKKIVHTSKHRPVVLSKNKKLISSVKHICREKSLHPSRINKFKIVETKQKSLKAQLVPLPLAILPEPTPPPLEPPPPPPLPPPSLEPSPPRLPEPPPAEKSEEELKDLPHFPELVLEIESNTPAILKIFGDVATVAHISELEKKDNDKEKTFIEKHSDSIKHKRLETNIFSGILPGPGTKSFRIGAPEDGKRVERYLHNTGIRYETRIYTSPPVIEYSLHNINILHYLLISSRTSLDIQVSTACLIFYNHGQINKSDVPDPKINMFIKKTLRSTFSDMTFSKINCTGNSCTSNLSKYGFSYVSNLAEKYNRSTRFIGECSAGGGGECIAEEDTLRIEELINEVPSKIFEDNPLCKIHPLFQAKNIEEFLPGVSVEDYKGLNNKLYFTDKPVIFEKQKVSQENPDPFGVYLFVTIHGVNYQFNLAEKLLWDLLNIKTSGSRNIVHINAYTVAQYFDIKTHEVKLGTIYTPLISNATQLDYMKIAKRLLSIISGDITNPIRTHVLIIDLSCMVEYSDMSTVARFFAETGQGKIKNKKTRTKTKTRTRQKRK
jgi:hypothetical protein